MKRPILVSSLLVIAIAVSFLLPKPKYAGIDILSRLDIPLTFADWKGIDVSQELNIKKDDRYHFISDVFARMYQNSKGEYLLLLILDAGNFHNPKVCYTSSGFAIRDLGFTDFRPGARHVKASTLKMERQKSGITLFYWLCIDKKIVSWSGQKVIELWSTLSNRKRAGLMVRIEVPSADRTDEEVLALSRQFIRDLNSRLSTEQQEYLFGK